MSNNTNDCILRVAIVGSRRRNSKKDKFLIKKSIQKILKKVTTMMLVSGGCKKGADRFAEELAVEMSLPIMVFNPDFSNLEDENYYEITKRFYARNKQIAENCDMLIALPAKDRKGGVENTISYAKTFKKPVVLL